MVRVQGVMELKSRAADEVVGFVAHQLRYPGNRGGRSLTLKAGAPPPPVLVLPALAVCEAQVQAVAGQEGVGVQREVHAGGVRDGLAQQHHRPGGGAAARFGAKHVHVTGAVENLPEQKEPGSGRRSRLGWTAELTFHSADLMLTVRPLLVNVLFIRRKKLTSSGSFISF